MLEVLTNTFGNRSPLVQSIKTLSCSMFCRILSLRYLWQSCKQFYVAVCLHQLIKRILITSMPHLEHNPSLLHQDPLQLLSNLTTQASSFSPTTHWSAALSPNKLFLIICGCWGFSPDKEGMHAACLEIVVWVLCGEQGGFSGASSHLQRCRNMTLVCIHHQQGEKALIFPRRISFSEHFVFPSQQSSFSKLLEFFSGERG